MKINLTDLVVNKEDYRSNWKVHFLMSAMSKHTPDPNKWKEVFGVIPENAIVDVKVLVNGVEMDFADWIGLIESSYEENVKQKAKELLEEKFENLNNTLDKLNREAQWHLDEELGRYGK